MLSIDGMHRQILLTAADDDAAELFLSQHALSCVGGYLVRRGLLLLLIKSRYL